MKVKSYLTAFCGIALLSACGGGGTAVKKEKTNDRIALGLKGEVKEMVEKIPESSITDFYTFNEAGYFLEKGSIRSIPITERIVTKQYEYGADGKLTTISSFSNFTGELEKKQLYNKDGNMTEEQSYSIDHSAKKGDEYKLSSTYFYTYNDEGSLIKSLRNKEEQNRSEYKCDGAGNILKVTHYSQGSPNLVLRSGYEYDGRGNITKFVKFSQEKLDSRKDNSDGAKDNMTESKYDEHDLLLEKCLTIYLFNDRKNEPEVRQKKVFTYQYDDKGNVTQMACTTCNYEIVDEDGNTEEKCGKPYITTYTYTYDKHDNWTLRETKIGNKVLSTVRRSFIYYGEEPPRLTKETLVGVWDYYSDPNYKYEIVFKKDETLIDFYDFHTTGTYKVNPEGTVLTENLHYNESGTDSGPMDFKILEFAEDRFVIETESGGKVTYERKAKSQNYDGEY